MRLHYRSSSVSNRVSFAVVDRAANVLMPVIVVTDEIREHYSDSAYEVVLALAYPHTTTTKLTRTETHISTMHDCTASAVILCSRPLTRRTLPETIYFGILRVPTIAFSKQKTLASLVRWGRPQDTPEAAGTEHRLGEFRLSLAK